MEISETSRSILQASAKHTSKTVSKVGGHPVRFRLPNGEKVGLGCAPQDTFHQIKEKIWTKKKLTSKKSKYVFAVSNAEITFKDRHLFSRLLRLAPVFRESGPAAILEARLIASADIGDQWKRQARRPSQEGPYLMQGKLYKRGRSSGSAWRSRYFVLESFTLFYFESANAFLNQQEAIDWIPMGSCQAVYDPDTKYKDKPFVFKLSAEHLNASAPDPNAKGKRDFVLCAETKEEMEKWLQAVYTVNFRRVKAITVLVAEDLERRGFGEEMAGMFRVSGDKEVLANIKGQYNWGNFPKLAECKDDHAVAGVMKLAIRELSEPIMTFEAYDKFIAAGLGDKTKLVATLADLVAALPQANRGFLTYLIAFLYRVSRHSSENKMTAKNLAIVFGPNLLRPRVETMATSMNDTAPMLAACEALIEHYPIIWSVDVDDQPAEEEDAGLSSDEEESIRRGSLIPPPNQMRHSYDSNDKLTINTNARHSPPSMMRSQQRSVSPRPLYEPEVQMQANPLTSAAPAANPLAKNPALAHQGIGAIGGMMSELKQKQQAVKHERVSSDHRLNTQQVVSQVQRQCDDLVKKLQSDIASFRDKIARHMSTVSMAVANGGYAQQGVLDNVQRTFDRHVQGAQSMESSLRALLDGTALLAQSVSKTQQLQQKNSVAKSPGSGGLPTRGLKKVPAGTKATPFSATQPLAFKLKPAAQRGRPAAQSAAPQPSGMSSELAAMLARRKAKSSADSSTSLAAAASASKPKPPAPVEEEEEEVAPPADPSSKPPLPKSRPPGTSMPPPPSYDPPPADAADAPAMVINVDSTSAEPRQRLDSEVPPPPPSEEFPPPPEEEVLQPGLAATPVSVSPRTSVVSMASAPASPPPKVMARALYDYAGGHRVDEVTFATNAQIEVLDQTDVGGWWKGVVGGKTGYFPAGYVEIIQ